MSYSSKPSVKTGSLVDILSGSVKQRRHDCIHDASKSMSRVSVLLMLLFVATWFHGWMQ